VRSLAKTRRYWRWMGDITASRTQSKLLELAHGRSLGIHHNAHCVFIPPHTSQPRSAITTAVVTAIATRGVHEVSLHGICHSTKSGLSYKSRGKCTNLSCLTLPA
jgi:hypothetical protein